MTTNADKRRGALRATATELQRPRRWRRDDPRGGGAGVRRAVAECHDDEWEFEIITRAIYAAAADRPRPARPTPATNDKTDSRGGHTDRKLTLHPAYLTKNLSYPLPTKCGDILITIQDARGHLLTLGPHQEVRPHWQRAYELLLTNADVETVTSQFHRALFMDGQLDLVELERINGARR